MKVTMYCTVWFDTGTCRTSGQVIDKKKVGTKNMYLVFTPGTSHWVRREKIIEVTSR